MNQPNLFSYATSELSQDAFICWLLEWASPVFKSTDEALHQCALKFVSSLFEKHKKKLPIQIEEIRVRKQDKNIDVSCVINNTYFILIEDKTGTKNHSNQLARYLEDVKSRGFEEENILTIYFKTEDQANYSDVLKQGYKLYLREDFLSTLNTYNGTNTILVDYRGYLQSISNKVERYRTLEVSQWKEKCPPAWVGFYLELQKRLGLSDKHCWDYVPNQTGGFLGFHCHWQGNDFCQQYLQLEEDKLCFKIWVKNKEERRALRSKWYAIIKEKSKNYGFDIVRPNRFGFGECMTVGVFNGEYRESNNGILDIEQTVALLRKAESLLKSVHEIA